MLNVRCWVQRANSRVPAFSLHQSHQSFESHWHTTNNKKHLKLNTRAAFELSIALCQTPKAQLALWSPWHLPILMQLWICIQQTTEAGIACEVSVSLLPNARSGGIQKRRDSPGAIICSPAWSVEETLFQQCQYVSKCKHMPCVLGFYHGFLTKTQLPGKQVQVGKRDACIHPNLPLDWNLLDWILCDPLYLTMWCRQLSGQHGCKKEEMSVSTATCCHSLKLASKAEKSFHNIYFADWFNFIRTPFWYKYTTK